MAGRVFASLCVAACFSAAQANAFLGLADTPNKRFEPVLSVLEGVLGQEAKVNVEQRVDNLTESLRATFLALPKSLEGHLTPAAVRYLLHRYFVDRHGWFVQGFEAAGDAWNSFSPAALFGQHVGGSVQMVFEERLASRGLSLHEVAVLAATLETLVHSETIARLHSAYRLSGLSPVEGHAKDTEVDLAMDTYMMMYVLGLNFSTATSAVVNKAWGLIHRAYPHWGETAKWVHEVRKEVLAAHPEHPEQRGSFVTTARVLEEVADRYGRWQDQECSQVKDSLVKIELNGTGRVPLTSFYEAALNGSRYLSETQAYLRHAGALDETDPNQPSVIIPNYINGNSNCIASSKFYSVCCINECEALLGHLERHLVSPSAEPQRIVELVAKLPSATVEAPRTLTASLSRRLKEIAVQHGDGKVLLHSRLFMQWLHHVYPRECPFPHVSGTSKPLTPAKYKELTGEQPTADAEMMRWHIGEARRTQTPRSNDSVPNPNFARELPWLAEDELLVSGVDASEPANEPLTGVVAKGLLLAVIACTMASALMHMFAKAMDAMAAMPQQKYSV